MDKRVKSLLEGRCGSYILPFFWQHGEDEAMLRDYMRAIADCGIGEVCIECRPHPDFCGSKWWVDMDIVMDEARRRNMRVWLLDDAHFPTGQANGKVKDAPDELCKQYLAFKAVDVAGPLPEADLRVDTLVKYTPPMVRNMPDRRPLLVREFNDDALLAVVAYRVSGAMIIADSVLDLTVLVKDGVLYWDVPDGTWRVFVMFFTRNGGRQHYINVLHRESCRMLIDAVYEPHYARYKDDFGKTFAGFFSDEPGFGNPGADNSGLGSYDNEIGRKMPLPWGPEVMPLLSKRFNGDVVKKLPLLWFESVELNESAHTRHAYMDIVTRLVEKNFSRQLGDWCEERGVEYIGHTIEDNNQHARLAQSFGHQFRGLGGQHMSGVDNISGQVLFGGEDHNRLMRGIDPTIQGEFYHFMLAKLASSQGHLDPRMQGRSLCEIYGAYGWSTGVRMMKYLTDHFLVRGVNHYVPHAFSPKAFPDADCPPHFYAHGRNPQYRHFGALMRYTNRVCHLINGGRHVAPAAVLYHAEGEWTGAYMFTHRPGRVLFEHQIDFDIVWSDIFEQPERFGLEMNGTMRVNSEEFRALVIPYAQFITSHTARFIARAVKQDFTVVFVDALPEGICDETDKAIVAELIKGLKGAAVVKLADLAAFLRRRGVTEVEVTPTFRRLRCFHYRHDDDIFMLSNEDTQGTFDGEVTLPCGGGAVIYDAFENVLRPADITPCESGSRLRLRLEPYESVIIVFGCADGETTTPSPVRLANKTELGGSWMLSLAESKAYPDFHDVHEITRFENVSRAYPDFSGFMRYETTFEHSGAKRAVLEIDDAYEGVEAWLNGTYLGMRICPPFRFEITNALRIGGNTLRIEVASTPSREVDAIRRADGTSERSFGGPKMNPPYGILGSVSVYTE